MHCLLMTLSLCSLLTHIEIIFIWIIEHLHQLNNIGMSEFLEDGNFSVDAI